jgi:hypothetical protein
MPITYTGSPEELQAFANQISVRVNEMNTNIGTIQGLQQTFAGAVSESQTAGAIQSALVNAERAATDLRNLLLQGEDAMRVSGAKIGSSDADNQSQINAAGYGF